LENRVTEALSYRLVLGPLWHIPDLEGVTDATTAAASLAPWQARINDLTSSLPENADLGAHAATVSTFVREVEPWASAYLDALAIGDAALAEASLAGLEARLAGIAHSAEAAISDVVADAEAESGILIGQLATLGGGNAGT
ncbi:MAG: hypothetical protein Q8Q52_04965, partial [Acidimicrobiia bacterium]|nr:hypothetical protein [Acidimicrobiia bacterium]